MPLVVKGKTNNVIEKIEFIKDGKLQIGADTVCEFTRDNLERAIEALKAAGYEFIEETVLCDGMGLLNRSYIRDRADVFSDKYMNLPVCFVRLDYKKSDNEDVVGIRVSHNRFSHISHIPSNHPVMWLSGFMEDDEIDGLYYYHTFSAVFNNPINSHMDVVKFMERYERLGIDTDIYQVKLQESYFKIPLR